MLTNFFFKDIKKNAPQNTNLQPRVAQNIVMLNPLWFFLFTFNRAAAGFVNIPNVIRIGAILKHPVSLAWSVFMVHNLQMYSLSKLHTAITRKKMNKLVFKILEKSWLEKAAQRNKNYNKRTLKKKKMRFKITRIRWRLLKRSVRWFIKRLKKTSSIYKLRNYVVVHNWYLIKHRQRYISKSVGSKQKRTYKTARGRKNKRFQYQFIKWQQNKLKPLLSFKSVRPRNIYRKQLVLSKLVRYLIRTRPFKVKLKKFRRIFLSRLKKAIKYTKVKIQNVKLTQSVSNSFVSMNLITYNIKFIFNNFLSACAIKTQSDITRKQYPFLIAQNMYFGQYFLMQIKWRLSKTVSSLKCLTLKFTQKQVKQQLLKILFLQHEINAYNTPHVINYNFNGFNVVKLRYLKLNENWQQNQKKKKTRKVFQIKKIKRFNKAAIQLVKKKKIIRSFLPYNLASTLNYTNYSILHKNFYNPIKRKACAWNLHTYYNAVRPQNTQMNLKPFFAHFILVFLETMTKQKVWVRIDNKIMFNKFWQKYLNKFSKQYAQFYWRISKILQINELLWLLITMFKTQDSRAFLYFIKLKFEQTHFKQHKKILSTIFDVLKKNKNLFVLTPVKGFSLDVRGKVGVSGNAKKRHIFFSFGKTTTTTQRYKSNYQQTSVWTPTGQMGIACLLQY